MGLLRMCEAQIIPATKEKVETPKEVHIDDLDDDDDIPSEVLDRYFHERSHCPAKRPAPAPPDDEEDEVGRAKEKLKRLNPFCGGGEERDGSSSDSESEQSWQSDSELPDNTLDAKQLAGAKNKQARTLRRVRFRPKMLRTVLKRIEQVKSKAVAVPDPDPPLPPVVIDPPVNKDDNFIDTWGPITFSHLKGGGVGTAWSSGHHLPYYGTRIGCSISKAGYDKEEMILRLKRWHVQAAHR